MQYSFKAILKRVSVNITAVGKQKY